MLWKSQNSVLCITSENQCGYSYLEASGSTDISENFSEICLLHDILVVSAWLEFFLEFKSTYLHNTNGIQS